MTAASLLAEFHRRGVSARVVGDRLRLAPAEALNAEILIEARRLKPELLRALSLLPAVAAPVECCWCGGVLAPYLLDTRRGKALLCPSCHRWTAVGGSL